MSVTCGYNYIYGMNSGIFKTRLVTALAACLVLIQCKRGNDPEIIDNGPVFSLKGTVNGSPFSIAATGDHYMFTEFAHSPSDSITYFEGRIEKTGCTQCGEAVGVTLYSHEASLSPAPVNIGNVLQNSSYNYADLTAFTSKKYLLNFRAEDSGYVNPSYSWMLGGATAADSQSKTITVTFFDTVTRKICLTITDNTTLCTKTICNYVKPFEVDKGDNKVPDFSFINGKTTRFVNSSSGHEFTWDLGDGTTSPAYNPEHLYKSNGTYPVILTTSINGVIRTIQKNVVIKDPTFTCLANYSYYNPSVVITTPKLFSKVKIWYRDASGEEYESNLDAQPVGSAFVLNAHEGFALNEKGEKTRSLSVTFRCRVYSKTTSSFKDLDLTGRVAVAHP